MSKWIYDGPVTVFGKLIGNWRGETIASSEKKARSNLAYQFKKQNNRTASAVIDLPGKLEEIN